MSRKRPARRAAAAAVLLTALAVLTGCQATAVLNGLTPRDGIAIERDVAYGDQARQTMDIYRPVDRPLRAAVIVFVYGGAWRSGDKRQYLFAGQAFAELGFVTLVPNYRLYPDATFPDFVDDVALAVATARRRLAGAGCPDGGRVIVAGHSAGAHSAALLATDPGFLRRTGSDAAVTGLIGLAGPYDLPLDDPLVRGKFDRLAHPDAANPVALATTDAPPTLLLHGAADSTVAPAHTREFEARLAALGVPVEARFYGGISHAALVGALASTLRFVAPVHDDIAAFLDTRQLAAACP